MIFGVDKAWTRKNGMEQKDQSNFLRFPIFPFIIWMYFVLQKARRYQIVQFTPSIVVQSIIKEYFIHSNISIPF